ncbi:MAG: hypothetical protein WBA57_08735 [Elainellaceae cyanobacterium]
MRLSNWVPNWRSLLRALIPLGAYPLIWGAGSLAGGLSWLSLSEQPNVPAVALTIVAILLPVFVLLPVAITAYLHHWLFVRKAPWLLPGAASIWEGLLALQIFVLASGSALLLIYYRWLMLGLSAGVLRLESVPLPQMAQPNVLDFILGYAVAVYVYHLESLVRRPKVQPEKRAIKKTISRR